MFFCASFVAVLCRYFHHIDYLCVVFFYEQSFYLHECNGILSISIIALRCFGEPIMDCSYPYRHHSRRSNDLPNCVAASDSPICAAKSRGAMADSYFSILYKFIHSIEECFTLNDSVYRLLSLMFRIGAF